MMGPESEAGNPPVDPSSHPHRWVMLGGVWLLYCCFGLTVASLAPLVAPISADLGLSHSAMGSVLGAWPLVYIASAVPCGAIMDRMGPRRALFIAAAVVAVSTVLRGVAEGHLSLFLAVAVFGLGGPLISVGAPKVIAQWFSGPSRGFAMGAFFTGNAVGGIAALSLTNSVVLPLMGSWRGVVLVYGLFVLLAGVVWLIIGAHPASRAVEAQAAAEEGRVSYFSAVAELVQLPVVRTMLIMGIFIFFFNHGLNNWLPEILRTGGMDPVRAGFWSAIPTAVGVIGALTIPRLAIPERRFIILGILFFAAACASLLLHAAEGPLLFAGLMLQGMARGSMTTIALLILMEAPEVGARRTGSVSGMYFSAAEIGGVMGPEMNVPRNILEYRSETDFIVPALWLKPPSFRRDRFQRAAVLS